MSSAKAAQATTWLLFRRVWGSLLNLLVTMYLVRILPASDFGIVAIVVVAISFCSVISSSGLGDYVVYYSGDDFDKVKIATFWLNITLCIIVSILIAFLAPFLGNLYGDTKITYLTWLFIIPFFSEVFNNVPKALLKKRIEYARMIKTQSIMLGVSILFKFVFALMGFGVYALVLPTVIIDPIISILIFRMSGLSFNEIGHTAGVTMYWRKIIHYTKFIVLERILGRVINEFDNLIVGKLLGLAFLAYYNQAFVLANLMTSNVSALFNEILLSVFSKFNLDLDKLRNAFSKVMALLAFIGSLILAIMVVTAPQIILLLLGSKFYPAVFPLQVLTFFAFFRLLNSPSGNIYSSLGKPHVGFYFVLFYTPIFLAVLFFAGRWGLDSFSICVTLIRILGSCTGIFLAFRLIKATKEQLFGPILPFVVAAFLSGFLGYIVNFFFFEPLREGMMQPNVKPFESAVWWQTALGTAATCTCILITYISVLKLFFDKQWKSVVDYLSLTHKGVAKVLSLVR